MEYNQFLESKIKSAVKVGFKVNESDLNPMMKTFQKKATITALDHGQFALFEDCGLGKTFQYLEWARLVVKHTKGKVIILTPLAIVEQVKREAQKFNIDLSGIDITNYEQLDNYDHTSYKGVVLDESSILKGRDRKTSSSLIDKFYNTPYKLCCTATPSPNDHMELGQHSEFLGQMTYLEMLAMYFVHDGGETQKWRIRKHAKDDFWKYVCSWSISIDNPLRLDESEVGYDLPGITYHEVNIPVENNTGTLFSDTAVSATQIHKDLKRSMIDRINKVADMINKSDENWIVWTLSNEESVLLNNAINDSINVHGSLKPEVKAKHLDGFGRNEYKCLITKTSIASFGLNYQNCHNHAFCSYDFKFEPFYQAVRRSYRFGQESDVDIYIMVPESQVNVRKSILEKQSKHTEMITEMAKYSQDHSYSANEKINAKVENDTVITDDYKLLHGDCVDRIKDIAENEVDLFVFSPPFADLYVYSDKVGDMGNVSSYDQFCQHFEYIIPQLKRTLKPGRICAVHCMDLPIQKGKEGFIGLRDFSGMIENMFTKHGFIYHARTTIWKNPVTEMQRTKALGLLHKQIKKDSSMSRVGIPDYILFFRNEGENITPITHFGSNEEAAKYCDDNPDFPIGTAMKMVIDVDLWQKYASPVWMDIDYSRTLQYRSGRDQNDEKHICPLQLDTIERIIHLYSNPGETVGSIFGGVGSEGFQAITMDRKSVSIEIKESYFNLNKKNHDAAVEGKKQLTLF